MSILQRPDLLRPGDRVAVVAPAGRTDLARLEPALDLIRSWGLQVTVGKTVGCDSFQFAGEDSLRLADISSALEDPSVKAIFCARGGYGAIRLFPALGALSDKGLLPKWVIGYSDITALHSVMSGFFGWQSIHGPMPGSYVPGDPLHETSWDLLHQVLFKGEVTYSVPPHPLNRPGTCTGPLAGGNISVIYGLNGTPFMPVTQNSVLFLEEIGEHMYHLDRMIINLKLSGVLKNLNGLIVGGMTRMKDGAEEFGKSAYEIIREHVEDYSYPVVFGFPAGHDALNNSLIMGASVSLNVHDSGAQVTF